MIAKKMFLWCLSQGIKIDMIFLPRFENNMLTFVATLKHWKDLEHRHPYKKNYR